MNLLARARGLQERIRPMLYLVSRGRLGNVRSVEAGINPRPGCEKSSWFPARGSHRPAVIFYLLRRGRGASTLPSLLTWNIEH